RFFERDRSGFRRGAPAAPVTRERAVLRLLQVRVLAQLLDQRVAEAGHGLHVIPASEGPLAGPVLHEHAGPLTTDALDVPKLDLVGPVQIDLGFRRHDSSLRRQTRSRGRCVDGTAPWIPFAAFVPARMRARARVAGRSGARARQSGAPPSTGARTAFL